jgi:predicted RNase H-like HicB family nuclease
MRDYHINIFFSEEDDGYIADIPDLDSCSAFGSTPEEALAEVEKAKKAWIEAAESAGIPIPPPRYRPAIYQTGPHIVRESGDSKADC